MRPLHRDRMRWYSYSWPFRFTVDRRLVESSPMTLAQVVDHYDRRHAVGAVTSVTTETADDLVRNTVTVILEPARDRLRLPRAHRLAAPRYGRNLR